MKRIRAVAVKELKQAFRDPLSLGLLLGVPTFILLFYGYVLNFDVRHVKLGIQDLDHSAASRALVAAFVNSTYFDRAADLEAAADLGDVMVRRRIKAVLVIPENYARELEAGRRASASFIIDGTDANTATAIMGYATALAGEVNLERLEATGRRIEPPIRYESRVWYNPELKSTNFLVPGLIGFILMLTTVLSTALSIVREKERGTMEQLSVAPLRTGELIVGKTLPYLGISLLAAFFTLAAARVLFHIVIRGPWLDLFFATILYLIGGLGLGLLVSTAVHSQAEAFQLGATLSMLPAILLSGFIFPIKGMPVALKAITYFVPARYYLVILRGIILKGAGLAPYGRQMAFLAAYALFMLGLAAVRLSRKET